MSDTVYTSEVRIEQMSGPDRKAHMPAEDEPVSFGVHGAIAEHYGVDLEIIEPHSTTLDYVVAAAGG